MSTRGTQKTISRVWHVAILTLITRAARAMVRMSRWVFRMLRVTAGTRKIAPKTSLELII